ncbi:MAG: hypothetical protein RXQ75_09850 [Acidianus hospitalis]
MDGRVVVFPSTRVNVYDPLGGVPVAELKVRISYATGKHLYKRAEFVIKTYKKYLDALAEFDRSGILKIDGEVLYVAKYKENK